MSQYPTVNSEFEMSISTGVVRQCSHIRDGGFTGIVFLDEDNVHVCLLCGQHLPNYVEQNNSCAEIPADPKRSRGMCALLELSHKEVEEVNKKKLPLKVKLATSVQERLQKSFYRIGKDALLRIADRNELSESLEKDSLHIYEGLSKENCISTKKALSLAAASYYTACHTHGSARSAIEICNMFGAEDSFSDTFVRRRLFWRMVRLAQRFCKVNSQKTNNMTASMTEGEFDQYFYWNKNVFTKAKVEYKSYMKLAKAATWLKRRFSCHPKSLMAATISLYIEERAFHAQEALNNFVKTNSTNINVQQFKSFIVTRKLLSTAVCANIFHISQSSVRKVRKRIALCATKDRSRITKTEAKSCLCCNVRPIVRSISLQAKAELARATCVARRRQIVWRSWSSNSAPAPALKTAIKRRVNHSQLEI